MQRLSPSIPLIAGLVFAGLAATAQAESCSYSEAIMALQQGNTVRGMALLRMASRDGDPRATRHLARLRPVASPRPVDTHLALDARASTTP